MNQPTNGRIIGAAMSALGLLSGCAADGVQVPKEVRVAVPVPCLDPADKPARPDFMSDGDILLLDSYRAVYALWGERLDRQAYEAKLEAIVEGCSRIPAAPH